jgi:hypothetical protein
MRLLESEERHRRRLHRKSEAHLCFPFLPSVKPIIYTTTMPYAMGIQSSVIVPQRGA